MFLSKVLPRECVLEGEPLRLVPPPLVVLPRATSAKEAAVLLRAEEERRRREAALLRVWQERMVAERVKAAYQSAFDPAHAAALAAGRKQGGEEAAQSLKKLRRTLDAQTREENACAARELDEAARLCAQEAEAFAFALAGKILNMPLGRDIFNAPVEKAPRQAASVQEAAAAAQAPLPAKMTVETAVARAESGETPAEDAAAIGDGDAARGAQPVSGATPWEMSETEEPGAQEAPVVSGGPAGAALAGGAAEDDGDVFSSSRLAQLPPRALQRLFRSVRLHDLALAMKGMGGSEGETLREAMPRHMRENVEHEMEFLGPVRPSDVQQAQRRVAGAVRRLRAGGEG